MDECVVPERDGEEGGKARWRACCRLGSWKADSVIELQCRMFTRKHPGDQHPWKGEAGTGVGRSPELLEGLKSVLADSTGTPARMAPLSCPPDKLNRPAFYTPAFVRPWIGSHLGRGVTGAKVALSLRLSPDSSGVLGL